MNDTQHNSSTGERTRGEFVPVRLTDLIDWRDQLTEIGTLTSASMHLAGLGDTALEAKTVGQLAIDQVNGVMGEISDLLECAGGALP